MAAILMPLIFLAGGFAVFAYVPLSWWPFSGLAWLLIFAAVSITIEAIARRHRGATLPAGAYGIVVGVAIAISGDGSSDSSDGGGDGGDGGGGGD
jgi:hypothetical protein